MARKSPDRSISVRRTRWGDLAPMPPVTIAPAELSRFGALWAGNSQKLTKKSAIEFTKLFDEAVGKALAQMLGGIPIKSPDGNALTPVDPNCVEVGPVRIVGGVRPQNFDVGYRPDGVRIAFDSKTLNDKMSIQKNWQNMINDIATEATTVHSRFPYAVVAFMVVLPEPAVSVSQRKAIVGTLERLARRADVVEPPYMAEAIALVLWRPHDGSIDPSIPEPASVLRVEQFSHQVEAAYFDRYKGLPPHARA